MHVGWSFPRSCPSLIGWAAARGRLDPEAWVLYFIVFLWQFPHFMSIAWMYRKITREPAIRSYLRRGRKTVLSLGRASLLQ